MSWINGLKKKFTDFELVIDQLEIPDEGLSLLQGPSGAGKSTLIRCLCGFEEVPPFQWLFGDADLMKLRPFERQIGYVPQTLDLFPHLSARMNILFPVEARKMRFPDVKERFEQIAQKLDLNIFLARPAQHLSGGEKQRVALARALILRPRILICDEPFSSLPENLRSESRRLIRDLISDQKVPALIVSHDAGDQTEFADHQIKIAAGKVLMLS